MDLNHLIKSNDFPELFTSDHVNSNKMRTYIKARKYKM